MPLSAMFGNLLHWLICSPAGSVFMGAEVGTGVSQAHSI